MENTQNLQRLIEQSVLLSPEARAQLLTVLPKLNPVQIKQLSSILATEQDVLDDMTRRAVERAAKNGDTKFLDALADVLRVNSKELNKATEGSEQQVEGETLEHFFDDQP
jgi:hypothetical protein